MATFGGDFKISKNTTASFEIAVSNQDLNTFSSKDANDNIGYALRMDIQNKIPLNNSVKKPWKLVTTAGYEQVHKNFVPIERSRKVEFERDDQLTSYPRFLVKKNKLGGLVV